MYIGGEEVEEMEVGVQPLRVRVTFQVLIAP
jgi:hypothetical protein